MLRIYASLAAAVYIALAPGTPVEKEVLIEVDAAHTIGNYEPVWNYFGADEPNYLYAPNGNRLLAELGEIDRTHPVYFRAHNLLTTGNGEGSLK